MSVMQTIKDAMQGDNNKKTFIALGLVVVAIVVLAFVTYFFFYKSDSKKYDDIDFLAPQASQGDNNTNNTNTITPITEINPTDNVNANNVNNTNNAASIQTPTTTSETTNEPSLKSIISDDSNKDTAKDTTSIGQLKYAIKPLDKNIASCSNMENGKWKMPNSCSDMLVDSIKKLIESNNEIIAIEVSGVVDNNPYAGPSAELKQEGLASFRAREAIGLITRKFSSIAAFEGLSIQAPNKRGFEVKAYYLKQ